MIILADLTGIPGIAKKKAFLFVKLTEYRITKWPFESCFSMVDNRTLSFFLSKKSNHFFSFGEFDQDDQEKLLKKFGIKGKFGYFYMGSE